MELKLFASIFLSIFFAELADKTQFATLLFAADANNNKFWVFAAASLALVCASALAVFAGSLLTHGLDAKTLGRIAGLAFIAIGVWTLLRT